MTNKSRKNYEYMSICRKYGLFTCGTVSQYEELADLYTRVPHTDSLSFIVLCYATWLCSDRDLFTLDMVTDIFTQAFQRRTDNDTNTCDF